MTYFPVLHSPGKAPIVCQAAGLQADQKQLSPVGTRLGLMATSDSLTYSPNAPLRTLNPSALICGPAAARLAWQWPNGEAGN